MHRDPDGSCLIRNSAGDGLPYPPGGVGRELVAPTVLELVDRLHEADVAFLNEIKELQAAVGVFLRDGDHEAEVGLGHLLLGALGKVLAAVHVHRDVLDVIDGDTDLVLDVAEPVHRLHEIEIGSEWPAAFDGLQNPSGEHLAAAACLA